jgi:antitoxin component of RelBE/YafQ-DinJ toxin-antitoxin module
MKTQVLYARIDQDLKTEIDELARERGTTLTSAVADLIARGLASVTEEESIARLENQLARVQNEKSKLHSDLRAAKMEADTVRVLTQRSNYPIGKCISCNAPFTGYELLATGQCSSGHPLGDVLSLDPKASTSDQREFLMFLGALGAVVGVAFLATRS